MALFTTNKEREYLSDIYSAFLLGPDHVIFSNNEQYIVE